MRQCRSWTISPRPMNLTMSDHWLLITVWIRRTINYCLSVPDNTRLCAKSDGLLGQNVHPRPSRRNLEQPHRHRPAERCSFETLSIPTPVIWTGIEWRVIKLGNIVVRWKFDKLRNIFIFKYIYARTCVYLFQLPVRKTGGILSCVFSNRSRLEVGRKREFLRCFKNKKI